MAFDAATYVGSETLFAQIKRKLADWRKPKTLLERIRLTPVPLELVQAHKQQVTAAFGAAYPYRGLTEWRSATLGGCYSNWSHFNHFVAAHMKYSFHQLTGGTNLLVSIGIPPEVVKLGSKALSRMRKAGVRADAEVEFFYTDPVVNLVWFEGGDKHKACLAIYDYDANGKVVMLDIATLH